MIERIGLVAWRELAATIVTRSFVMMVFAPILSVLVIVVFAVPAVAVIDEYQGRGIGALLLDALSESALVNGITTFRGFVARENSVMLTAVEGSGARIDYDDYATVEVDLPAPIRLRDSAVYGLLRSAARGEVEFGL